jgi:MFS-type transporter involved in bile tolerance (Atg22 family)
MFSFGGGYNALIRSILTSLVEQHHIGTLYNMIAVIETVGQIFAGPLLSGTFRQGMNMGGAWIGLPFIVAGGLFATAAVVVFSVRLPNMLQH